MKKILIKFIISLAIISIIAAIFYISTIPSVRETWDLATTIKPETFTELYFEDHLNLPKNVALDQDYSFRFTIHNLENNDMTYQYEMYIELDREKQLLDKKYVLIKNNEYKTILESFILKQPVKKAKVVVKLINKNQDIAFWIEGTTPIVMPTPTNKPLSEIQPAPPEKQYGGWYWRSKLNKAQIWLGINKDGNDIWADKFPLPIVNGEK